MLSTKLLDTETFFDTLLTRATPSNVAAIQDYEPDSYDELPAVRWQASNNGQTGFGLWNLTLTLTVLDEVLTIQELCRNLYQKIHLWQADESGHVDAVGGVVELVDGVVFDKVSQIQIHGKHLAQHVGSFNMLVREVH